MLNYEKIAEEKNRNRFVSGFTLIELLIVVAIILILVAILTIRFTGYSDRAREASTKSSLNSMQTIVESYASDEGNGKYPLASNDATNTSSVASVMQSHGINWTGDSKGITDPWKTPYRYNSNDNGYIIVSAGKDKTFGTSDDIYVGSYTDTESLFYIDYADASHVASYDYIPYMKFGSGSYIEPIQGGYKFYDAYLKTLKTYSYSNASSYNVDISYDNTFKWYNVVVEILDAKGSYIHSVTYAPSTLQVGDVNLPSSVYSSSIK